MMHKLLFGVLLVICATLGIVVVFQVSSLQCPYNTELITERPADCVTTAMGENASLSGVCSENWLLLNRMCYFFSKQKASQAESDQTCRSLRGKLAAIKPTLIILTGYVRSLGVEYWVGLKKENRDRYPQNLWYWSDNAIEENIIDDGSNSCAKISQTLSTESCSTELLWICEKEAEVSHTQ